MRLTTIDGRCIEFKGQTESPCFYHRLELVRDLGDIGPTYECKDCGLEMTAKQAAAWSEQLCAKE